MYFLLDKQQSLYRIILRLVLILPLRGGRLLASWCISCFLPVGLCLSVSVWLSFPLFPPPPIHHPFYSKTFKLIPLMHIFCGIKLKIIANESWYLQALAPREPQWLGGLEQAPYDSGRATCFFLFPRGAGRRPRGSYKY